MNPEERIAQETAEIYAKLERLRSLNSSLDESLEKIKKAISETAYSHENETPPAPSGVFRCFLYSIKGEKKSQGDREHSSHLINLLIQFVLCVATIGAFIAAAIYAHIAGQQRQTMEKTYWQIGQQTRLLRQQLIAVYSSTVTCVDNYGGSVSESGKVRIYCHKFGIGAATAINVRVKISRQNFPSLATRGKPSSETWTIPRIDNTTPPTAAPMPDGAAYKDFDIPDFKPRDWTDIQSTREVIKIEGTFNYNNGFEAVPDASFCRTFIHADLPDPPRVDNRGRYQIQDFFPCETFKDDTRHIRELQQNISREEKQIQK